MGGGGSGRQQQQWGGYTHTWGGRQVLQCLQNRICIYLIYEVTSNVLIPLFAPKTDHKSENLSHFVPEIDPTTKNVGEVPNQSSIF